MTLKASATIAIAALLSAQVGGGAGEAEFNDRARAVIEFENGTGVGKADLLYSARRTIAANSAGNIDLAGVLTDAFGAVITAAKVKLVYIKPVSGQRVRVGGAASNAALLWFVDATDKLDVPLTGVFCMADPTGWTVTAGTGDILGLANPAGSGADAVFDIIVLGASA